MTESLAFKSPSCPNTRQFNQSPQTGAMCPPRQQAQTPKVSCLVLAQKVLLRSQRLSGLSRMG